jgi:FkbM family methyltransferase
MVSISKSRVKQQRVYSRKEKKQERLLLLILATLLALYAALKAFVATTNAPSKSSFNDHRPHLKFKSSVPPLLDENYNAIAQDIITTLNCASVLNKTQPQLQQQQQLDDIPPNFGQRARRRLQQERLKTDDGDDSLRQDNAAAAGNNMDDEERNFQDDFDMFGGYSSATGTELFCLAASTTTLTPEQAKNHQERILCDATGTKQEALLELWSSARAQIPNEELLKKTLELATETTRTIGPHSVNLWAPTNDDGMNYVLNQVSNAEESARLNGNNFYGLSHNLGPDHLYIDVGSCLGITTLAVILQYPKTKVVSVEPAAPNWFMQQMNIKCNLEEDQHPTLLLAGVGPHHQETMAAKLLWRPAATTSTRSWTPAEERVSEDVELMVQLKSWKSILAEADVYSSHHIDVLHIDCEGCEYNLIPSLTDSEYGSIDTVMGDLHWGYIPKSKLPSSERGKLTHNRLCQHENFARTAKECCGNLDLTVRSSIPGEVLIQEGKDTAHGAATVKDVIAEGLCDDFDQWIEDHQFYTVENDYGWFELSSVAT